MPVYNPYGGVAGSFGEGLMQGFNFIDSMMARRQQAEDRKRALALEDERMRMAREDQQMQREQFDNTMARQREADLDKTKAEGAAQINSAYMTYGKDRSKWTPEQKAQVAGLVRQTDPTRFASVDDETALQQSEGLAQLGGTYLQTEAVRQREEEAQKERVSRVLTLQGVAAGAVPVGSMATPAPATSAGVGVQSGPGAPRGLRNNNPGNLRATDIQWQGKIGNDGEFEQFATPADGLRAAAMNLANGGTGTLRAAITRWAPPTENDTAAYIQNVSQQLGVDPDQPIDLRDPQVNAAVLGAIVNHENGQQPFSAEDLLGAANSALGQSAPAPAARTASPAATPQRASLLGVQAKPKVYTDPITEAVSAVASVPGKLVAAADNAMVRGVLRPALDPSDARGNDVRANPTQYLSVYQKARSGFSPDERAKLDTLMYDGLTAQLNNSRESLSQFKDPKLRSKVVARIDDLRGQLAQFNVVRAKDIVRSAVPRWAKPGETAADAVGQAVAARGGDTPEANAEKVRLMATRADRMGRNPPTRLSASDLDFLADAVVHNVISMEQASNIAYGRALTAPAKPTVYSIEGGLAVITDAGIQFVQSPFSASAGGGAAGDGVYSGSEARLRSATNVELWSKHATGMLEDGSLDPFGRNPAPSRVFNDMLQTFTRSAPQLEAQFGIRMHEPGGKIVSFGQFDPGTASAMSSAFADYAANELYATVKDGHEFPYYLARHLGMDPQQAAARLPQPNDVIGGYRYVGPPDGDRNDKKNWEAVQ